MSGPVFAQVMVLRQFCYLKQFAAQVFAGLSGGYIFRIACYDHISQIMFTCKVEQKPARFCSIMMTSIFFLEVIPNITAIIQTFRVTDPQVTGTYPVPLFITDPKAIGWSANLPAIPYSR